MSVSILCLLLNIVSLSICDDVTFYIKPTFHFGGCPSAYQPCLTLDQYARHELQTKPEKVAASSSSFTLIFLPGNHISCEKVDFTNVDSFTMIGMNSSSFNLENPQTVIELMCDDIHTYSGFSISHLAINGKGRYSIIMRDGIEKMSIVLFQVKLVASAVLINSGHEMFVNISRVFFKASKINVNSTFAANILITDSIFHSGNQSQTMAFCHKGLYHTVNILFVLKPHFLQMTIDNVTIFDLPQTETYLEPPGHNSSFCDPNESRLDTGSDFALLLQPSDNVQPRITIVNVSITNSNFIHNQKNSTAMILELLQSSHVRISNMVIHGYTQGAIVVLNHWTTVVFKLHNTTIEGNSLSYPIMNDLEMNAGAGLTIYNFIHELKIPMYYEISNCVFQNNVDSQEKSEIVLIYGMNSIYINDSVFANNYGTAISAHDSKCSLIGSVEFDNNSAKRGGALALYASILKLTVETKACFYNNSASEFGGAIYVENPSFDFITNINRPCFYQVAMLGFDPSNLHIHFESNTATEGGDNIYGAQISGRCLVNAINHNVKSAFTFIPNNTLSSVSSRATRICLCDSYSHPQCTDKSRIFVTNFTAYPGEMLSINATTVGAEFGTTTGNVYAKIMQSSDSLIGRLGRPRHALQPVSSKDHCTTLKYSIYSQSKYKILYLVSTNTSYRREYEDFYYSSIDTAIEEYTRDDRISTVLLTTPIFINITLKECPPGFNMTGDSPYMYCDCYAELLAYNIRCTIQDGIGHITREGNNWVGVYEDKITFNDKCLSEYCRQEVVTIGMEDKLNESDSQCAFNHAGVLCGGCKEGYSVDLGSSHCLYCPGNSKYATAVVAFLFGGLMLVGIILLLNLKISNGGINGLIFYANIVWAYRSLMFPHSDVSVNDGLQKVIKYFFKIFIATLNLDIGFQMCFWDGMDAFSKSILQFAIPIYIWIITGVAWVMLKYCSCCLRCRQCKCAQRPVKVLVTLILMSYAKLIRTVLGVFTFSVLKIYPGNATKVVWSLDGNVPYLKGKHVGLFVIALVALFVALIYTVYIFVVGLISREDKRRKCQKILDITMPLPLNFYDAHFVSFKENHRYWLGLLLFVRAFLLVIFSSTLGISPVINLPILILVTTLLLFWMGWKKIYKKKSVWVLQGLSLSNLIVLSGGVLYAELANKEILKSIFICVSIGIALLQFAVILGQNIVQYFRLMCRKCTNHSGNADIEPTDEQVEQDANEPLLNDYSGDDTHPI